MSERETTLVKGKKPGETFFRRHIEFPRPIKPLHVFVGIASGTGVATLCYFLNYIIR